MIQILRKFLRRQITILFCKHLYFNRWNLRFCEKKFLFLSVSLRIICLSKSESDDYIDVYTRLMQFLPQYCTISYFYFRPWRTTQFKHKHELPTLHCNILVRRKLFPATVNLLQIVYFLFDLCIPLWPFPGYFLFVYFLKLLDD